MVSDWFGLVLRHSIENCSKKISFQYHKWYRGIPSYQTLHFSNLPITQTKLVISLSSVTHCFAVILPLISQLPNFSNQFSVSL